MRLFSGLVLATGLLAAAEGYKQAPERIRRILDAPATPQISVSPAGTHALLLRARRYPPVAELAEPMLRLAGLRINPRTNGPHKATSFEQLELNRLDTGAAVPLTVPAGMRLSAPGWSADGQRFAFTNAAASSTELWVGSIASGQLKKLPVSVNAAYGDAIHWHNDGIRLIVLAVPSTRDAAPPAGEAAAGPVIQESRGQSGPVRTYQDMLKGPHDEALLDYYGTSQPLLVNADSGETRALGQPALYESLTPSPNGEHLLVRYQHRPYSYVLPSESFPAEIEVWDLAGKLVKKIASLPMRDRVPIDGVATGPRLHAWRPTEPATITWVEALDNGDPKVKVPHRDRLLAWRAPFAAAPREYSKTEQRFMGARWLERDGAVLITDYDRDRRWTRTQLKLADADGAPSRTLWARNMRDRYADPGTPVMRTLPGGHRVVRQAGDAILLDGDGASPQGNRPFLDRFNLRTSKTDRLFHCEPTAYETTAAVLSDDGARIVTRRETPNDPPNFLVRAGTATPLPLTREQDPAPELRKVKKELVRYKRGDGVDLSFTLYLPPDYQPGTRLPTVMWAYPLEYNDASTAGQVSGSRQRFTTPAGASHLFYLLAGYAVLDDASMPVVGTPETVNDNYLEQIAMSAKAAIQKAAEMGVTDPKRVGVGGHSYGAFMTANLLAHSDLFRAGVARSGAYNRTLTPFGFQAERRTLWEAPETYLRMSPFMNANKINEPILLIHGEADNNAGTFPIQSDRLYQAIRGNGGTVRLVMLPHESHGYAGRESIEHTLAEMIEWFDRHVKPERE